LPFLIFFGSHASFLAFTTAPQSPHTNRPGFGLTFDLPFLQLTRGAPHDRPAPILRRRITALSLSQPADDPVEPPFGNAPTGLPWARESLHSAPDSVR
jgi:hypothetical protein